MTVNNKWNLVSTKIINIMKHYVPVRLTTSRYNLPWFNKDLKKMCIRKKRLYKKAKISRNPEDWQEFCNIRKDMHKHLRSVCVCVGGWVGARVCACVCVYICVCMRVRAIYIYICVRAIDMVKCGVVFQS